MESLLCRKFIAVCEPVTSFVDDLVGNSMLGLLLIAGRKLGDDFVTFIAESDEQRDIPDFPDGTDEEKLEVQ